MRRLFRQTVAILSYRAVAVLTGIGLNIDHKQLSLPVRLIPHRNCMGETFYKKPTIQQRPLPEPSSSAVL